MCLEVFHNPPLASSCEDRQCLFPFFLLRSTFVAEKGATQVLNLTSSGEACSAASQTRSLKATTQDGLNIKIPNKKWVMAGSHILGL